MCLPKDFACDQHSLLEAVRRLLSFWQRPHSAYPNLDKGTDRNLIITGRLLQHDDGWRQKVHFKKGVLGLSSIAGLACPYAPEPAWPTYSYRCGRRRGIWGKLTFGHMNRKGESTIIASYSGFKPLLLPTSIAEGITVKISLRSELFASLRNLGVTSN